MLIKKVHSYFSIPKSLHTNDLGKQSRYHPNDLGSLQAVRAAQGMFRGFA